MGNCFGFGLCGKLLCLEIIVLGLELLCVLDNCISFGKCFVFWIIVFLLGSVLCIVVLKG